jgi:hypothetical protein
VGYQNRMKEREIFELTERPVGRTVEIGLDGEFALKLEQRFSQTAIDETAIEASSTIFLRQGHGKNRLLKYGKVMTEKDYMATWQGYGRNRLHGKDICLAEIDSF